MNKPKEVATLTRRDVTTILENMMGWEAVDSRSFWRCCQMMGKRGHQTARVLENDGGQLVSVRQTKAQRRQGF